MDTKGKSSGRIFAENEQYILRFLQTDDKENYMETTMQNSDYPRAYDMDGFADYCWQNTPEENELIFCIFDKATDTYCGFCNLRHTDTDTPEVGISLLSEHHCKGIGYQALRIMMDTYSITNEVEYYIAKVSAYNTHSQHLMEKLGAVQSGREDSEFRQAVNSLMSKPDDTIQYVLSDLQERYEDENQLIVYHL
ncbi:MAG: GNAT family N-acetyltransferase [Lachnospiraceae bacterium]|nr:GNAT family N-acetyltransferase [Lachnospiraceae bacterium]MCC8153046.1 GNAT family N-acetyltransferase [Tannerellaceae bacterium]